MKRFLAMFGFTFVKEEELIQLENKIDSLKKELKILIEEPDSVEAAVISLSHIMSKKIIDNLYFATHYKSGPVGIFNTISKS